MYIQSLPFAHNTQGHRSTKFIPFIIVVSRYPPWFLVHMFIYHKDRVEYKTILTICGRSAEIGSGDCRNYKICVIRKLYIIFQEGNHIYEYIIDAHILEKTYVELSKPIFHLTVREQELNRSKDLKRLFGAEVPENFIQRWVKTKMF